MGGESLVRAASSNEACHKTGTRNVIPISRELSWRAGVLAWAKLQTQTHKALRRAGKLLRWVRVPRSLVNRL